VTAIDAKTACGSAKGAMRRQATVAEKSNEIIAIPKLLDMGAIDGKRDMARERQRRPMTLSRQNQGCAKMSNCSSLSRTGSKGIERIHPRDQWKSRARDRLYHPTHGPQSAKKAAARQAIILRPKEGRREK
jgi:hypothetical protein